MITPDFSLQQLGAGTLNVCLNNNPNPASRALFCYREPCSTAIVAVDAFVDETPWLKELPTST